MIHTRPAYQHEQALLFLPGSDAASFESMRHVVDLLEKPMLLLGLDGIVRGANPAAARLLGWSESALLGKSIGVILPPEALDRGTQLVDAVAREGAARGMFSNRREDGRLVEIEAAGQAFRGANGEGWIVIHLQDLSPELDQLDLRIEALRQLAEPGADVLHRIVKASRRLIDARYAALGVIEDGRLVQTIVDGASPEVVAGMNHLPEGKGLLRALMDSSGPIRIADIAADPRAGGMPDGHPEMHTFLGVPIDAGGRRVAHLYFTEKLEAAEFSVLDEKVAEVFAAHVAIAIRDQIERQALADTIEALSIRELDLAQAMSSREVADAERDRLATAVEQAAEGVFLLALDKTITYANPAARELYGLKARDLIGRKMSVFGSGQHSDRFWADVWATVKAGDARTGRVINRHRDGRTVQVDAVVSPVYDQSGALTAFVASHRDVTDRVDAEAERGRLVAALEQIGDAVFIFDRDRRIQYTNAGVEQVYGYDSEALGGTTSTLDSGRHDAAFWDALWGTVEGGRTWSGRIVNRHRDGHEVTVESTISPVIAADGEIQGFIASDRDVTDRIATETERARLVSALEQAAEGIFILEPDLVVSYANEAGARMYGYRPEELIGRMLTVIDSGVHEGAFFEAIYSTTAAGKPWLGTVVNRHRDGHLIEADLVVTPLVDAQRRVTGVIESHRDVTERTASEAERVRLASAVEQAADGIFILEPNGTVAYVNRSATRIYGYSRDEFVGRDMRLLDSGAHPSEFFHAQWADVLAGRTWSGSITKRHRNGSLVQVESVITPMSDSKGRLTGIVESHRDVTRERALEDALEREARERESIEAAIRDIDPTAPPERMAAAATVQILQLTDVGSAGVLDLTPGHETTVGVAGLMSAVFGPGGPISPQIADVLRARLAAGPWVQDVRQGSLDPASVPPGDDWPKTVAYAPFHGPGGSLGAIAIATHDDAAAERFAERVPALTAFASLLGALLGPALDARHRDAVAHTAVRESLDPSAFTPFFQPIVSLDTRVVAGYEALTRFSPSSGDPMGPIVAFAAAARVGLGLELEIVTLRAALAAAKALPPEAFVSLNVSPELMLSGRLAELLTGQPREVVLEITEHVAISDYVVLRRSLKGLGSRVRLAVDDAGAGFASFRHILELAPDFVKLDIDLVRGIDTDPARQALVAGMTHFATDRGLHLIAEGIETKEELVTLRSLGLELGQGYLLGRPRDSRRTRKWPVKVRLRAT